MPDPIIANASPAVAACLIACAERAQGPAGRALLDVVPRGLGYQMEVAVRRLDDEGRAALPTPHAQVTDWQIMIRVDALGAQRMSLPSTPAALDLLLLREGDAVHALQEPYGTMRAPLAHLPHAVCWEGWRAFKGDLPWVATQGRWRTAFLALCDFTLVGIDRRSRRTA